ncbi:MAG: hypothetical protein AB1451_01715 [Nitrospirota bacterium]
MPELRGAWPLRNLVRSAAAWLLIMVLAILNGIFREAVLLPGLGKPVAFLLSGFLLCLFILAVAVALARWLQLTSPSRCLTVGALWLGLTLIFEFGFGMVQGQSWTEMLQAYTFKDGNIWPLVLVATFVAPLVAARVRMP